MKGSIKKRGKTYSYRVDIGKDPVTGKRKQRSKGGFRTKKEAEKALALFLGELEQGMYKEDITMRELFDKWLKSKNRIKPSTKRSYNDTVNNHLKPYFGNILLKNLKPEMINNYYFKIIQSGLSSTTALYHHKILKQSLRFAINNDYIYVNVVDRVEAPLKSHETPKLLTTEQLDYLIQIIKDTPLERPVFIVLGTGIRRGECLGMQWRNIDFKNRTISITNSLSRSNSETKLARTKTKSSVRILPIGKSLLDYLTEIKKIDQKNKAIYKENYNNKDYVVCWENGDPYSPDYVTKTFAKLIKKSNLPNDFKFKNLRHQHASLLLKLGIQPKVIQERLGHSNISTTMDVYSHLLPNIQNNAIDIFEKEVFSQFNILDL